MRSLIKAALVFVVVGLTSVGRLVKSCGKSAKHLDTIEDASRFSRPSRYLDDAGDASRFRHSSEATEVITRIDDFNSITESLELDESPSLTQVNANIDKSRLSEYFKYGTTQEFKIDSIHHFKGFKIYVPNFYKIREYKGGRKKRDVLQLQNGEKRFRISKVMSVTAYKADAWIDNQSGVLYKPRTSSYVNDYFEESYYIRGKGAIYQVYFECDEIDKHEIPEYSKLVQAFIHLISVD